VAVAFQAPEALECDFSGRGIHELAVNIHIIANILDEKGTTNYDNIGFLACSQGNAEYNVVVFGFMTYTGVCRKDSK
jgi:hypothetical protein